GRRQTRVVPGTLEDPHRIRDLLLDAFAPPLAGTARAKTDEQPREGGPGRGNRCDAGVPCCLVQHLERVVEAPGHEERLSVVGQHAEPGPMLAREKGRGTAEQRCGAWNVAASERAPARRGEAPGALLPYFPPSLVQRAELREVGPGLLEVVAEDLLELDHAVAVRQIGPRDEARVEVRPCALEDAVVGGVPDHDVVEAVCAVRTVLYRTDEVLVGQGRELGSDAWRNLRRCESRYRLLGEDVPDDRRGLDHRALARLERVEPGREERLDRGRDVDLRELLGEPPHPLFERQELLVHEHPEELLREEWVPLGRRDDAIQDDRIERPPAEQALDHALRVLGVEWLEHDARRARARAPLRRLLEQLGPG